MDLQKDFGLRLSMYHLDELQAEKTEQADDSGYYAQVHDTGRGKKFLIVKKLERTSHGRKANQPENLRLEVYRPSEVPLTVYRNWQESDEVEVQEVSKIELWGRILGENQKHFKTSELRDEQ